MCATVQLWLKSGLLLTNQIQEFWYSYDNDFDIIINIVTIIVVLFFISPGVKEKERIF